MYTDNNYTSNIQLCQWITTTNRHIKLQIVLFFKKSRDRRNVCLCSKLSFIKRNVFSCGGYLLIGGTHDLV